MSEQQYVFATIGEEEEEIYPPTIEQIAAEQRRNRVYKPYFKGTSKNSKKKINKRNPVAREVKTLRPKIIASKKCYDRKRQKIDAKNCDMSN